MDGLTAEELCIVRNGAGIFSCGVMPHCKPVIMLKPSGLVQWCIPCRCKVMKPDCNIHCGTKNFPHSSVKTLVRLLGLSAAFPSDRFDTRYRFCDICLTAFVLATRDSYFSARAALLNSANYLASIVVYLSMYYTISANLAPSHSRLVVGSGFPCSIDWRGFVYRSFRIQ